jgi:hypothetical protein
MIVGLCLVMSCLSLESGLVLGLVLTWYWISFWVHGSSCAGDDDDDDDVLVDSVCFLARWAQGMPGYPYQSQVHLHCQ